MGGKEKQSSKLWLSISIREEGRWHQNKGGGELGVTNTKPACNPPPSHIYSFLPSVRNKKRDHTGNIHSFRKQFYVTYKWKKKEKKKRWGVGGWHIQIPKIQHFTISFPTPIPFTASCPSRPPQASLRRLRSLCAAPPLTAVRTAGVLGRETGWEGISAGGRSLLFFLAEGVIKHPPHHLCFQLPLANGVGVEPWRVDVSWPPSCSCCKPTCSSETSAEWKRSGSAVQCRSVEGEWLDQFWIAPLTHFIIIFFAASC